VYPSAEARWFSPGPLPPDVLAWFERVAGEPGWESRTDCYARPTAPEGLNVKWREGKLEVKRLVETLGREAYAEGVAAPLERWRKWSFPLTDEALRDPHGDWAAVAKRRQVRRYAAEAGGVRPLGEGQQAPVVCGVEIGEMTVGGRTWWSVCFEAYGQDEEALPAALRLVAAHVVAGEGAPRLPAERAMNYVRWLAEEVG
jgi:hypothetical protein